MKNNDNAISACGKNKMKPIVFNTEMVQTILRGEKIQTRRVIKPQFHQNGYELNMIHWYCEKRNASITGELDKLLRKCPYGQIGSTLYVRETFCPNYFDDYSPAYKADATRNTWDDIPEPKWKPSIHMPKKVARIFLKITAIRIERVQDITEKDAKLEGIKIESGLEQGIKNLARARFADLWDRIYKNWDDNPWVWVIDFKVIEKPLED